MRLKKWTVTVLAALALTCTSSAWAALPHVPAGVKVFDANHVETKEGPVALLDKAVVDKINTTIANNLPKVETKVTKAEAVPIGQDMIRSLDIYQLQGEDATGKHTAYVVDFTVGKDMIPAIKRILYVNQVEQEQQIQQLPSAQAEQFKPMMDLMQVEYKDMPDTYDKASFHQWYLTTRKEEAVNIEKNMAALTDMQKKQVNFLLDKAVNELPPSRDKAQQVAILERVRAGLLQFAENTTTYYDGHEVQDNVDTIYGKAVYSYVLNRSIIDGWWQSSSANYQYMVPADDVIHYMLLWSDAADRDYWQPILTSIYKK